jgi:hypothetical protein
MTVMCMYDTTHIHVFGLRIYSTMYQGVIAISDQALKAKARASTQVTLTS